MALCLVSHASFDGMWAEPGSDPREALEPGTGEKAVLAEYLDRYRTDEDPDLDFNHAVADDEVVAEAWDTWRDEVENARSVYADLDLDAPVIVHTQEVEARDIVVHLVEECARHVDLLRECIDGRTGQ